MELVIQWTMLGYGWKYSLCCLKWLFVFGLNMIDIILPHMANILVSCLHHLLYFFKTTHQILFTAFKVNDYLLICNNPSCNVYQLFLINEMYAFCYSLQLWRKVSEVISCNKWFWWRLSNLRLQQAAAQCIYRDHFTIEQIQLYWLNIFSNLLWASSDELMHIYRRWKFLCARIVSMKYINALPVEI